MKKSLNILLIIFVMLLLSLSNPNVYAAETHTITFVTGDESIVMEPYEVEDGDTINDKGIDFYPAREGYAYPEWYTDSAFTNEFDFETKIYKDTTLYAKWLVSIERINITADSLTVGEPIPNAKSLFSSTTEHITIGNASWESSVEEEVKVGDIVDSQKEYSLYITAKADDGYTLDGAVVYANGKEVGEWIAWPLSMGGAEIGGSFFIPIEVNPSLEIINGTETYTIDESTEAEFEINADYSLFEQGGKVYVDGNTNPLDSSNYTSKAGSTIITLKKDYVDTLSEGKHTLKVVFNDDKAATTSFTVAKNTLNEQTNTETNANTETTVETKNDTPQTSDNNDNQATTTSPAATENTSNEQQNIENKTNTETTVETKNDTPKKVTNNPQTGDNIILYISILALSIIGFVGAKLHIRKNIK